jgi:hypothetical protein
VERLIRSAVKIACHHLMPAGLERELWKGLSAIQRFYYKGLEVESHGEHHKQSILGVGTRLRRCGVR